MATPCTKGFGKEGNNRSELTALIEGTKTAEEVVQLANPHLRASAELLTRAITGSFSGHQRLLLQTQLSHIRYLEQQIAAMDEEVAKRTAPFEEIRSLLRTIPGVSDRIIDVILAEIGPNVNAFLTAAALAKWAGIAPGNKTSGGKRFSGRTQPGDRFLRTILVQVAWAASRTKNTYLQTQYRHLIGHLGKKKAILAVAHSILQAVWIILKRHEVYKDLGPDHFDKRNADRVKNQAIKRLQELGHEVILSQTA